MDADTYVDPRGPRFVAALTTLVLAAVLLTGSGWLLAGQAAVFALGAATNLRYAPYAILFRRLVRPRLQPPGNLEPVAPVRFAQLLGFLFAAVGTVGYATGATAVGIGATAAALAAAFLNAAFGLCLGCELYLLFRRSVPRRLAPVPQAPQEESIHEPS
jgi:predicted PurR-regulated permease PerM